MSRNAKRLRLAAVILVVGVVAVIALVLSRQPPEVPVVTVRPQTTELVLAVVGRVRPLDLVEVRSPNPGEVIELLADDGDQVAEGQPLARLRAAVEAAQTDADAARVLAAQAEAAEARLAFQRTQTLARKASPPRRPSIRPGRAFGRPKPRSPQPRRPRAPRPHAAANSSSAPRWPA